MSKTAAIVRYDGPALAGHSMDVADLAPALLALSGLVKTANRKFNGGRSSVKVLVNVDTEQQCFQFYIEIAQTLLQQAALLVQDERVATAKEIAEWIGLIGGTALSGGGIFQLYKWLAKNKVSSLEQLEIQEGDDNVILKNVNNSGSITVNKNTYLMMGEPSVLKNVKSVIKPLTGTGYEKLQFEHDDVVSEEISVAEGIEMDGMEFGLQEPQERVNKTTFPAKVKVKKPDLIGDSKWSVIFDKTIDVKVEDAEWLDRFHANEVQVPAGSYLSVDLRIEIRLDDKNDPVGDPSYFVSTVHDVIPPAKQDDLFD
ncbi:MAG: hypothetical protein RIC29_08885 [Rhodospirillaceae bacterium]